MLNRVVLLAVIIGAILLPMGTAIGEAEVPRITIEDLKARLDSPGLVVIDVRASHDWKDSTIKIRGAVREDPSNMGSWIDKYPKSKTIVLYCA